MKKVTGTLIAGMIIGAVALIAFDGALHATSTDEFCGSCHEMGAPQQLWTESQHYGNSHGVGVGCSECHIPQEFFPKMWRKMEASREVWGHWTGIIDTPEKYAEHQPAMRERELNRLRANDSQECRNCHRVDRMDFEAQERAVRRYHRAMKSRDKTCVDCHEGIAHARPLPAWAQSD